MGDAMPILREFYVEVVPNCRHSAQEEEKDRHKQRPSNDHDDDAASGRNCCPTLPSGRRSNNKCWKKWCARFFRQQSATFYAYQDN